jgi:hypothetical protein
VDCVPPPRLEHQPFFYSGRGCTRNAGSLAEEMDDFNHAIIGTIAVIVEFHAERGA